ASEGTDRRACLPDDGAHEASLLELSRQSHGGGLLEGGSGRNLRLRPRERPCPDFRRGLRGPDLRWASARLARLLARNVRADDLRLYPLEDLFDDRLEGRLRSRAEALASRPSDGGSLFDQRSLDADAVGRARSSPHGRLFSSI